MSNVPFGGVSNTLFKAPNSSHCSFSTSCPSHTGSWLPAALCILRARWSSPDTLLPVALSPLFVCREKLRCFSLQPFHDDVTFSNPTRSHGADMDPASPECLIHAECCCSIVNQTNPTTASRAAGSSWKERLQDTMRSN